MRSYAYKIVLFLTLFCLCTVNAQIFEDGIHKDSLEYRVVPVKHSALAIFDIQTVHKGQWTDLPLNIAHPAFDSLMTSQKKADILQQVNLRQMELNKDTLLTADLFYVLFPYFDWLHHVDPHYRITTKIPWDGRVYKKDQQFFKQIKRIGFNLLLINDSLLVNTSIDPNFKRGDLILSINGIPTSECLKYNYHDRYTTPEDLLQNYYFSHIAPEYKIKLQRNNKEIEVTTPGVNSNKAKVLLDIAESMDKNIRVYERVKCGYIALPKFERFYNPRIIKIIQSEVAKFKQNGLHNVILDLRNNHGGSGYMLDKLLSLFINKPSTPYLKSLKLKISEETRYDYDFITDNMQGKLIELPSENVTTQINFEPKLYIDGIRVYILMSKDTGSVAASFCNILQYNNAAILVGESLHHNALKFGETIDGKMISSTLLSETSVSTMEFDEYTKAVDGVLAPDTPIPYVASDYLSGKDAMLEKLLKIIADK